MVKALGYAATHSYSRLKRLEFEREEASTNEIEIEVLYCGVCHSDIHQVKNEWSNTVYPCVPGHEVVGRVTKAGPGVTRHAVGDVVGVGCMIESCRHCEPCQSGDQNYCEGPNSWLSTYNGPMVPAAMAPGPTGAASRRPWRRACRLRALGAPARRPEPSRAAACPGHGIRPPCRPTSRPPFRRPARPAAP